MLRCLGLVVVLLLVSTSASAQPVAMLFTDDPVVAFVTPVKAAHVQELRTALAEARAPLGLTAIAYTDPTLDLGTTKVKAAHVQELRAGVK